MGIVDPIAMTNGMASGMVGFPGAAALWLMLLGLLIGSAAGVVFAGASRWPLRVRRPRLTHAGRPMPLAEAAK